MKSILSRLIVRRRPLAAAIALAALLAGCFEKRILWSPDGTRAAVLTNAGLRFTDANGRLTPVLVSGISAAAWIDPQRLVLARRREVGEWAAIARVLGPRAAAIEAEAAEVAARIRDGARGAEVFAGNKDLPLQLCLRDRHAAELGPRLPAGESAKLQQKTVAISEVLVGTIRESAIEFGPVLLQAVGNVLDLRPAPGREVVAATMEMKAEGDECQLFLLRLDRPGPAVPAARRIAQYPDWKHDGSALVLCESTGSASDAVSLGVVVRRALVEENGVPRLSEKPEYLAGTMFNQFTRIRCLRDGRVLFNAAEFTLPLAAEDYGDEREQLFALDASRQVTLVRLVPRKREADLPQQLSFFEVSPDETQVLFGAPKGAVSLLTLATGEVKEIQKSGQKELQGAPVWRGAGEIAYFRRAADDGSGARPVELVLRKGERETVLSREWSSEVIAAITGGE